MYGGQMHMNSCAPGALAQYLIHIRGVYVRLVSSFKTIQKKSKKQLKKTRHLAIIRTVLPGVHQLPQHPILLCPRPRRGVRVHPRLYKAGISDYQ